MNENNSQYGDFIDELCCNDCNYAGEYNRKGWCPLEPVRVCPDCGGKLSRQVGRWLYTETIPSFWTQVLYAGAAIPKTTYHKFVRGRK